MGGRVVVVKIESDNFMQIGIGRKNPPPVGAPLHCGSHYEHKLQRKIELFGRAGATVILATRKKFIKSFDIQKPNAVLTWLQIHTWTDLLLEEYCTMFQSNHQIVHYDLYSNKDTLLIKV